MNPEPNCRLLKAYLIHAPNECIIGRGIVLHCDKNTITLCCSDIDQVRFGSLGVDAVNFHDPHCMAFDPKILTGKSAHINDTEHVSLSRFDWRLEIDSVIHEGSIWYWLSSCWVSDTDEALHEVWYMVVIPVGYRQYSLFIVLSLIRRVRIIDNQRSTKTIGILSNLV